MKTKNLLLPAFLFAMANCLLQTFSFAQTNISGGTVSGTWTLAGSPYLIHGSISIPNDSTLNIQPGVTVKFQGKYKLLVQGRLLAIGSVIDTIIFTTDSTTNGWRGIRFETTTTNNDTSKIKYCKLEYGNIGSGGNELYGGDLFLNNFSKVVISNCHITNGKGFYGSGIYCRHSSPNISNCHINSCGGDVIYCDTSGNPIFSNNIISYNIQGPGIYCAHSSPTITNNTISHNGGYGICNNYSSPTITNNTISYNGTIGIIELNSNSTIANNTISNNPSGGISCTNSNSTITNNTISNNTSSNGGGINFNNSSPTITNNTIANNAGVTGGALYFDYTSSPTFRNNILWGNTASSSGAQVFINDAGSSPNFYYCDVQGGKAAFAAYLGFYTGTYQNNINIDPKFVAPSGGSGIGFDGVAANWSLQISSPCIDMGDPATLTPATDKAGNPRVIICRIDMGAYEYQNGLPFLVSVSKQNILCYGGTGSVTASVSSGITPYTYSWSNGQTTSTVTGLSAGNYTITVNDAGNCNRTGTVSITSPVAPLSANISPSNASCGMNDGSATANPIGGTLPYTYSWSTGQSTQTSTGMGNNIYSVLITDANGCSIYKVATVGTNPHASIPICIVTVDSTSSKNVLVWDKPQNTAIDSFKIYREISSVFTFIASVPFSALSTFTDNTNGVNPNITSYRYEMSVKDTCGNESAKSVLHQTMHLAVSPANPCGYNLFWNDYIGFPVMQYRILRNTTGNYNNWQTLDSVSLGINVWTDTACSLPPITAYIVEVIAPAGGCTPALLKNNPQPMATTIKGSKSNSYRIVGNSVNEISLENLISISPNPNNGEFTVQSSKIKVQSLEVHNVYGEKVYSEIVNRNSHLVTLDLPNGIYFAHIQTEMGTIVKKVIVTH